MKEIDIENVYKMFLDIQSEKIENYVNVVKICRNTYCDDRGNSCDLRSRFFSYLVELHNFGGFPTVVEDEKFENINSQEIYHGFREFDHGAQLLTDWNYHVGVYGAQGTFFTDFKDEAIRYTAVVDKSINTGKTDKEKVLRAKILSENPCVREDIMGIRYAMQNFDIEAIDNLGDREKMQKLYDFCFKQKSKVQFDPEIDMCNRQMFFRSIIDHMYTLALYLGYDSMVCYDDQMDYNHYVLFDRSKMVVPESEVKKFCDKSKNYQGNEFLSS